MTDDSLGLRALPGFIGDDVANALPGAPPAVATPPAAGAIFSSLWVFGDSLSDAGNVALATAGTVPVPSVYANGTFTDGPIWAQDLANLLGLGQPGPSLSGGTDFAYGGAHTGQTSVHDANVTDLPSQISQFYTQASSVQPNALYSVWIGTNDIIDIAADDSLTPAGQQSAVSAAVGNEVAAISDLAAHGATNFLVLNVPNLGFMPLETQSGPAQAQLATSLSEQYNDELATALQSLSAPGNLKIDLVDTFALLGQAVTDPANYGLTNATDPVWTGNITDPDSGVLQATGAAQGQYLFFDKLSPTAQAHSLLAAVIPNDFTG